MMKPTNSSLWLDNYISLYTLDMGIISIDTDNKRIFDTSHK
jgi:hypothetical protein